LGRLGLGDVAGLVGRDHADVGVGADVAGDGPAVVAFVAQALGDRRPRALFLDGVEQIDRAGAEVLVAGGPRNVQAARFVARARTHAGDFRHRAGQVPLDPPVGSVAGVGRRAAEAAAVRHDQAQAEQTLAGQIDFRRALAIGVLTVFLPGLAVIEG